MNGMMQDEGKILVIGSAVADVVIELDHLPGRCEDVHVRRQEMRLGGCAYNVCDMIRHFQLPFIPFMPVGSGAYGEFVQSELRKRGINSPIPRPKEENGCCYCFVEEDGERTFISYHGAEYRFYPEWFQQLEAEKIRAVYICGLEIEETTGPEIIRFLEKLNDRETEKIPLYFAPGPRLTKISPDLMERIFDLHPILHLNEEEAVTAAETLSNRKVHDAGKAAQALYEQTGSPVIVTMGKDGCCYYDGLETVLVPGEKTEQVDTIGAGDSHVGAVIAELVQGKSLLEAVTEANRISAAVVRTTGALLSDEAFRELGI